MPLLAKYRGETSVPVEVEGFLPEACRGKSLPEIERLVAFHGNRKLPLAEFFSLTGSVDEELRFEGNLAGVHWIGKGLSAGTIRIEGPAGRHVGSEMSGGEIHVHGDTSDWVGAEMKGGLIHVHGRAGHLVGAAYRGSRRGMNRGTILIEGDAGNEIGHTMRRGLIAIGGSAADFVGVNMIAGSVYVFGSCGIRPGAGMKRGTVGLFGPEPPSLLPSFRRACRLQPGFVRFALLELARFNFPFPDSALDTAVTVYNGDLVALGKGEILLAQST